MDASWLFSWVRFKPQTPGEQNMIPYVCTTPLGTKISSDALSQLERLPFIRRSGKLSLWFTISLWAVSDSTPLPNEKAGPPESLCSGEVANPTRPVFCPTSVGVPSIQPDMMLGVAKSQEPQLGYRINSPRVSTVPEGPAPDMSPSSSSHCLKGSYNIVRVTSLAFEIWQTWDRMPVLIALLSFLSMLLHQENGDSWED